MKAVSPPGGGGQPFGAPATCTTAATDSDAPAGTVQARP
jgi:hypothetical protein